MSKAPDTTPDIPSLRAKAELGDKSFQLNFGWCYEHGEGVKQDWVEAAKWYRMAAEQGHDYAQQFLSELLVRGGHGLKQNYEEAAKWCRMAANHGKPAAQCLLGDLYLDGLGVPQDYAEAYFWYCLAPRRAKEARRAEGHLTPEQKEAVNERVKNWKPTPVPALK
jgi:TPR repeat protein